MTAKIIAMPSRRLDDGYSGRIDPRSLAVERALQEIEGELCRHLDAVERVAITAALERLADEAAARRRDPWC